MIFCASFCPFGSVASHDWCAKTLDFPSEENPIPLDMFCLYVLHLFFSPCRSGWTSSLDQHRSCANAFSDFHSVSNSVNIPTLVFSELLQLLFLSSNIPSPSHRSPSLPPYLGADIFFFPLWIKHKTEKRSNVMSLQNPSYPENFFISCQKPAIVIF